MIIKGGGTPAALGPAVEDDASIASSIATPVEAIHSTSVQQ
jgi:hypothetical protein